jgi:hypothetical protein
VKHTVLSNPNRRSDLDVFYEVRQCHRRVQAQQNVRMVAHAINPNWPAVVVIYYAVRVTKEIIPAPV